jgi:hypothetical protein
MLSYIDAYDDDYLVEREDGTEVCTATDPAAAKDAARSLIRSGEEAAPLTLVSLLTGQVETCYIDPKSPGDGITISGNQGGSFR